MNKKWLITIGVVLGVVVLGAAAYFAWQNRKQIAEVIPAIVGGGITPVQRVEGKLKALSSREVASYWVSQTGTSSDIFYSDGDKNIIKVDQDGIETTDSVNLKGAIEIAAAPSGSLLFGKLNKEGGAVVYDVVKNVSKNEFIGIDTAAWGPEDGALATIVSAEDAGSITPQIMIGNTNNEKPFATIVSSDSLRGFGLQWPQADSLYLVQKPSADYSSDMWKVDIKTKKMTKFLSGNGLMVKWSKFGDVGLMFTTTPDRHHALSIINNAGAVVRKLSFVTTPDKCTFTSPTQMYCAISRDQEALADMQMPDDYLKRAVYFKDGIYQIDTNKNTIRAIFEDENPDIDATNLTVMEDKILFINRYDRKLYSLNLQ